MTAISRTLSRALILAISLVASSASAQDPSTVARQPAKSEEPPGPHIAIVNGYPELHFDGEAFFVHAADFPYYGLPQDLWAASLDRYAELGINTISLRVPWSWHALAENQFDFEGQTNPRRDLRKLLALIAAKNLKLIVRAGPAANAGLRGDGYPDWLLARPEFAMPAFDRLIGVLPAHFDQFDSLVKDETQWFTALARELSANAGPDSPSAPGSHEKLAAKSASLLYVIFDLGPQASANDGTSTRALESFREAFVSAGVDSNFLVMQPDAANAVALNGTGDPIGIAAQWPQAPGPMQDLSAPPAPPTSQITVADLETASWLAQNLRLQPRSPSVIAALMAKQQDGASRAATAANARTDLLLGSRAFLAQGIPAISYGDFQVSLAPPGYESAEQRPLATASLDVSANPLPPAEGIRRNGDLIQRSGFFLASAHRRTILGIVDWRSQLAAGGADPVTNSAISHFEIVARKIERVAALADLPVDLVDPDREPLLFLLHDTALLLIVPAELRGRTFLSEKSQQALLEFARRGGSLICTPELPPDSQLASAAQNSGTTKISDAVSISPLDRGHIVAWSSDFYSWVRLEETAGESRKRGEAAQAISELTSLLAGEHARSPVLRSVVPSDSLSASELLPNIMETAFGITAVGCHAGHRCGEGLLSLSNVGDSPASDILRILPPTVNHRTASDDDYVSLPVEVPPRESLMLPLDTSLCIDGKSGDDCADRVVAAGAELHKIAREGKTLELTFFAPANATVILHLEQPPHHVELLERSIDGQYSLGTKMFTFQIPRGPAPGYERLVKLQMPYTPHVAELPKPESKKKHEYTASILNDVRVPAPAGNWLPSFPALVALDASRNGHILLNVKNLSDSWFTVKADVSGAAQGSTQVRVENQANNIDSVELLPGDSASADDDGLLHGQLHLSNKDHSIEIPLRFYTAPTDTPVHYRFDFERSGSADWVLENKAMRIVIAPAKGGRIESIARKNPTAGVTGYGGALRDYFQAPGKIGPAPLTLNTAFDAHWTGDSASPGVEFTAHLAEELPLSGELRKTIRMKDERKIEVAYQFAPSGSSTSAPRLISTFSVAASEAAEQGTEFCWSEGAGESASPQQAGNAAALPAPAHCEAFHANAPPLQIPENVRSLEIRNQGQQALTMEWPQGSVSIRQGSNFAELRLEFSAPRDASAQSTVSYTLAPGGI